MLQFTKSITIPILKNPTKSNSMLELSMKWKNRWVISRNFTIFQKKITWNLFSQAFSKKVRSKYIAYTEPAKVRLQVGTRIVGMWFHEIFTIFDLISRKFFLIFCSSLRIRRSSWRQASRLLFWDHRWAPQSHESTQIPCFFRWRVSFEIRVTKFEFRISSFGRVFPEIRSRNRSRFRRVSKFESRNLSLSIEIPSFENSSFGRISETQCGNLAIFLQL